jgi:hypothetical protein
MAIKGAVTPSTDQGQESMCPTPEERTTLRRILKRADYATSEMQAVEGDLHLEEVVVIRRIEAATIPTTSYPLSKRQRLNSDLEALLAWENEGGAILAEKFARRVASIN